MAANVTNVTLTGALDDARGRTIAIYQDHDGVRIDVGSIEIMLGCVASSALRGLLRAAEIAAEGWQMEQDAADA